MTAIPTTNSSLVFYSLQASVCSREVSKTNKTNQANKPVATYQNSSGFPKHSSDVLLKRESSKFTLNLALGNNWGDVWILSRDISLTFPKTVLASHKRLQNVPFRWNPHLFYLRQNSILLGSKQSNTRLQCIKYMTSNQRQ